jgi:uncharacterized protein
MLAESARRGGLPCSAVDHFADLDTLRYADACRIVPPGEDGGDGPWIEAVGALSIPKGEAGIVYGSGLDTRPGLLAELEKIFPLFGNPPEILARINQPRPFFQLLDELAIPFPETRFTPPRHAGGWLVKPGCGEGGKGVGLLAEIGEPQSGAYFQKYLPGPVFSALFLANGRDFRVIGFNTLWAVGEGIAPFLFEGAINRTGLDESRRAEVEGCLRRLVEIAGLRGLNGVDFALDDRGGVRVLEINPRPSASMALYDADFPGGLLRAHLDACLGELPDDGEFRSRVRAFRIVHAKQATLMPCREWPSWVADIPRPGQLIGRGEPVCTAQAAADDCKTVKGLLDARVRRIQSELEGAAASVPGATAACYRPITGRYAPKID